MEPQRAGKLALGIMMVLIYLGFGAALLFLNIFNIDKTLRMILGALFALYAIFRGFRLWRSGN